MKATIIRFDIIDIQTGKVVDTATTRDGANRKCDNRDHKYGAVRFIAKAIWSDA